FRGSSSVASILHDTISCATSFALTFDPQFQSVDIRDDGIGDAHLRADRDGIVLGFVGSLALGIILWVSGGAYLEIRVAQSREQKEYFACLDQGRDAWNKYITAGPQHNIDFSHADLSNRNFNGFFFEYVTFKHADLTGTVFEDCNLQSAWFDGAICHNTSFKNSYLNMADFIKTDLTGASLEGAFGEKNDFKKATIDPRELEKLRPPVDSRWHNTSWQDFHSPEWLRAKGYYVEAKPTAESID
ncbi:MAG: pentapeptide repeat-containing protein, partial [Erysipelotrichia bacterium]|nr:pentapeptide repeat-containing protein [Erysipelotrichia bacterium]